MPKKKNATSRIFKFAFRYKGALFFTIFFSITYAAGQIGGVMQIGSFFQETLIGANLEYVNAKSVLILLGFGALWAASHYVAFLASNTLSINVIHDLREKVYQKMVDLPISYYKKNDSGEILSRLLNDMSTIDIFLQNIVVHLVAQPATVIGIIAIMITMSAKLTGYFFLVAPVLGLVLAGLGGIVQNLSHRLQKNMSDITSGLQETIYGIEVLKGYGVEKTFVDKFKNLNDAHLKSGKKELRIRLLGTPVSEFLGVVAVLVILILGALSLSPNGWGIISDSSIIINFLLLALVLSQPLSQVGNILMVMRKLRPAAERIFEIIDLDIHEDFSKPDIGELKGEIVFQNAGFEYESGKIILSNINLTIRPGETVAVIGPSGAGKSTLISLIPLFNTPSSGKILIDGKDGSEINPLSLRKQLSLVTQESILFSGTIADNIKMSKPDATMEEIVEAAKKANADTFIREIKGGYDTMLGEKGVNLSGGQRQRIVLARAILRNPKILILDEATSSLDAESEHKITEAMDHILGKQTTIIITHKLSSIAHADKIIVIEDGKIIEQGTHEELIQNKGIYTKLYQLQINL